MYFQMQLLQFELSLLDVHSNSLENQYYSEKEQLTHLLIQSNYHLKGHLKYSLMYSICALIHLPVEKDFKLCMRTGGNALGISKPRNFKLISLQAILNSFISIFPSASVSDNAL